MPDALSFRRSLRLRVGLSSAALILGVATVATAQQARVSWVRGEGASSCARPEQFLDLVRERLTPGAQLFGAYPTVTGVVERTNSGYRAEVFSRDARGRILGQKSLAVENVACDSITQAASLAVAMALEGAVLSDVETGGVPPPVEPHRQPPLTVAHPAEARVSSPPKQSQQSVGVGWQVGAVRGLTPFTAPVTGPRADIRLTQRASASLGMSLVPDSDDADHRFSIGLTYGSAGGCFEILGTLQGASAGACVAVHVGAARTVSQDVSIGAGGSTWVAAQPTLHARIRLLGPLEGRVEGGAILPLLRHAATAAACGKTVFRQDAVAPLASIGAFISFL